MARIDNRGNQRGSLQNQGVGALGRARAIKGTDDFLALSKRLKATGETGLRKELHKALRDAAKPLARKVKDDAPARIGSHRGGIGEHYGKKPVRAQVRTGARTAGVRLVMPKTDQRVDSQGRVFHPVFGRKGKAANGGKNGVAQTLPAVQGFFSESAMEESRQTANVILEVIRDYTVRALKTGI